MVSNEFLGKMKWTDFQGVLHEKPLEVIERMLSYLPTACKTIATLKDENLLATGKTLDAIINGFVGRNNSQKAYEK